MKISHKITNISGEDVVYIYVTVEDIYEFGKENLGKGDNTDFLTKLREYIKNNLGNVKKTAAIIVINGVIVGSLTLTAIYPGKETAKTNNEAYVEVYEESVKDAKEEEKNIEENSENSKEQEENKKEENVDKKAESKYESSKNTNKTTNKSTGKVANKTSTTVSNKTANNNKVSASTTKPSTTAKQNTTTATTKPATDKSETQKEASGITINFNNGGVVSKIDLEEYVIGVVAAEMPASFHIEALKAQAVLARTYAMKKASKGITLINSTSHQVYSSISEMKSKWGSSYTTYYNKIKDAVNATKGKVLKYNGGYIEALYFSISNGKTEQPSYVWSTDYPYLQAVSSSWDEGLSAAKHTITMSYEKISTKLGVKVDKTTEIKILSRTAGERVNEISIAGKTFTGVKIRSVLGLRSADFNIKQTDGGVTITTIGFGHGVGMSQYGANGAAKAGYTYKQILTHYFSGTSLVNL